MTWDKKHDVFELVCGHGTSSDGSWDCGCVYGKYTEADLMLKITKEAVKYLHDFIVKKYNPDRCVVRSYVDDAAHSPVTVEKVSA